jgi:predicted transcriptional regulator
MHPLKQSRLGHGMSVRRLADSAGVSDAVVQRAEAGSPISELSAYKIGQALDEDPVAYVALLHDLEPLGTPEREALEREKQPA